MTDTPPTVGRDVVVSTTVAAPAPVVYGYFVDLDKLTRWMGHDGTIVAEPGGIFRLHVTDQACAVGEFVELVPPERVVFTWGWEGSELTPPGSSTVTVSLQPDGDATVVTLVHRGLCEGEDDRHEAGWTYFSGRLAVAGAGDDPGPQAHP